MKTCNRCNETKPRTEFFAAKWSRDGLMHQCKKCRRALVRDWEKRNPEKMHSIKVAHNIKYREERRAYNKLDYQKNIVRRRAFALAKHHAHKDLVFKAYGGYVCACCGETELAFLCIDHINNDGAEHRRKIKRRVIYRWLVANGFPPGYQVLCANCNQGKQLNGGVCPHQKACRQAA